MMRYQGDAEEASGLNHSLPLPYYTARGNSRAAQEQPVLITTS